MEVVLLALLVRVALADVGVDKYKVEWTSLLPEPGKNREGLQT